MLTTYISYSAVAHSTSSIYSSVVLSEQHRLRCSLYALRNNQSRFEPERVRVALSRHICAQAS